MSNRSHPPQKAIALYANSRLLYVWALCMISPKKNGRKIKGEISKQPCNRYQKMLRKNKGNEPQIHGSVPNLNTGLIKDT